MWWVEILDWYDSVLDLGFLSELYYGEEDKECIAEQLWAKREGLA